jgi:NTE family protein
MAAGRRSIKRGLVLGCGGVAGAAWSIAALDSLRTALDWDPRAADVIVGTSAGAVLAALLGAGVSVDRMLASQRGDDDSACCVWNHDADTGGWLPPLPKLSLTSPRLFLRGLFKRVSPLTAVAGLLPQGRADMSGFIRLIETVAPDGEWVPHPAVWIMAADAATGARVAFGSPEAPPMGLSDAVCASYAVPGWCPPVTVGERTYLDGGIASPTSADFLLNSDLDEVAILAPMAASEPDHPRSALAKIERAVRRHMTSIVDAEVGQLRERGIRVIRLEPGAEDLQAIGFNMMDPRRRKQVFETALRTTSATVKRLLDESCR